jgi:hypothetical protein
MLQAVPKLIWQEPGSIVHERQSIQVSGDAQGALGAIWPTPIPNERAGRGFDEVDKLNLTI